MAYDIIGDIHGQAGKLEALLTKLGYAPRGGCWQHPSRIAIFLGDFIDRGPEQLRTLSIVRPMVEAGAALAVLGNHELNAIAWHTPDDKTPGDYLRPHSGPLGASNRKQHQRFLEEVGDDALLHADMVGWFKTLPLWLDLDGIRVVHACWHAPFMDWLAPSLTERRTFPDALLPAAICKPESLEKNYAKPSVFAATEALTKEIEIPLPAGHSFLDKDGITRWNVRIRWWDQGVVTYREAALLDEVLRQQLPDDPLPAHARFALPTDKPFFIGHYWMTGTPAPLSPRVACLDYSAGKGGPLVAYRWDGESCLEAAHFCAL